MRAVDLVRRFAAGVWDFVVGDDWLLALGVAIVLLASWFVSRSAGSWLVVLVGVPLVLWLSLRRALKPRP